MNKSEIRKKILKLRKQNSSQNLNINFHHILKILKKEKVKGKIIGGYYPFNYEIDVMKVLNKFEKQNYIITLPKIKKTLKWIFFTGRLKNLLI